MSSKGVKVVLAAAVAAMAMAAMTAASASATIVPAKFSTSSGIYIKTTGVTIKKNGGSPKSCSLVNAIKTSEASPGFFIGSNESFNGVKFTCSGSGPLKVRFYGEMMYDTVTGRYWLQVSDYISGTLESPWGWYWQETYETDQWTWVNGSGATPSTMTLNEQWVGNLASPEEKITISGTLTATTLAGGLITLSH